MALSDIQKPGMHRRVERKVKRRGADAAGQRAAQRLLQVAPAERQEAFRIGKEKPRGGFVLAASKLPVPICGELIVVISPRTAEDKHRAARNQKPIRGAAELSTLELQQLADYRVYSRRRISEECLRNGGI